MSIDRIGKGGGGPVAGINQPGSPSATDVGSKPAAEFKISKGEAVDATAKTPLDQVRSGEISVSQYLDIKVNEATLHLDQRVSSEQLSFIRDSLREQLSSDPVLVDLVKATTGALPPRSE
jgi:hypothetical protein